MNDNDKIKRIQKRDKYYPGIFFIIIGIFVTLPLSWAYYKKILGFIIGPLCVILGIYLLINAYRNEK